MIEVRHLKLIKEIATTGNMTRAADKLFLTQPSLSHQLKEVEIRLGTPLFLRVNKRMVLTPAGKRILDAADEILPKLKILEKDINGIDSSLHEIRLCTKCYTAYHWLPPLIKKFSKVHQDVNFEVIVEAMDDPVGYVLKDQVDIAITNARSKENGVHFEKLFDDEQVLLVPADHPLAKKPHVVPSDFKDQNLIIYKESFDSDHFSGRILIPAGITPAKITKMQLTEARLEMVKAGLGVTVLSRWLVKPLIKGDSSIKQIRITSKGFYRTWYTVALDQKKDNPYIKQFISFLKEQELGS